MKLSVLSNVRTNNFNDKEVGSKIGGAWQQALSNSELLGGAIYGVYHNYEGNYTNDYDLSICIEGELEGKDSLEIKAATNYKVFEVPNTEEGIMGTWSKIWGLEESGEIDRTYGLDFELHKPDGTKEIHIAVA